MADAAELRRWLDSGANAVKRARDRLDAINVFPVADSDTGTNIYLTLREGNRAVADLPKEATHKEVVAAFARGALLGARGNSGVIVSAYLNAFLTSVDARGGLSATSARDIYQALDAASDAAYSAVGSPVEGTILTVAKAAASAAHGAVASGAAREATIIAAVVGARAALSKTQQELGPAREAGVVDAGAAGLVLQLEMLAETLAGPGVLAAYDEVDWSTDMDAYRSYHPPHGHEGGYEVMFVAVNRSDMTRELNTRLEALGDSVAVIGSHGLWQAHVHTERPGDAVRVAMSAGARKVVVRGIDDHAKDASTIVALTTCPGLADALAEAGACVLLIPVPDQAPRKDLMRALRDAVGSAGVVVAGDPTLLGAARKLAAKRRGPKLTVLDTAHEAHVVAAIAASALATPGESVADRMAAAIAATHVIETSPEDLDDDVDRLLSERTEVVTVIVGRGVDSAVADRVRLSVAAAAPHADVAVYEGNQVSPAIAVGVENAPA
ncbi:DAK2 domain-containing protein [Demequina sp.]|uniref:DAK2 domain-containing protein n=1 Tax=Demequina sp. TaxID=2050685 RepID=UPI003D102508